MNEDEPEKATFLIGSTGALPPRTLRHTRAWIASGLDNLFVVEGTGASTKASMNWRNPLAYPAYCILLVAIPLLYVVRCALAAFDRYCRKRGVVRKLRGIEFGRRPYEQ